MKEFIKKHLKDLLQDESGQGTTEYILILVGVVALAILFKDRIVTIVSAKIDGLSGDIAAFKPQ